MIWLTWRQFRAQAAAMGALIAVLAVALVVAGRPLTGSALAQITKTDTNLYFAGIIVTFLLPAIIGMFWGAPLVTRELEAGTHRLVWNQTVTRTRWLVTKLALTGLAAMAVAGLLSLAVSWWANPIDAASEPSSILGETAVAGADGIASRVSPVVFGARGIVPVGYAAFAFVLGVTAGVILKRTVLAMAVTLAVFAAVQLAVPSLLRPHVIPATQESVTITPENINHFGIGDDHFLEELDVAAPQGAWVLRSETVDGTGQVVRPPAFATSCLQPPDQPGADPVLDQACFARLANEGYRQRLTYEPSSRFWPMQWAETGIFLALSALLAWLSIWWTRRRLG